MRSQAPDMKGSGLRQASCWSAAGADASLLQEPTKLFQQSSPPARGHRCRRSRATSRQHMGVWVAGSLRSGIDLATRCRPRAPCAAAPGFERGSPSRPSPGRGTSSSSMRCRAAELVGAQHGSRRGRSRSSLWRSTCASRDEPLHRAHVVRSRVLGLGEELGEELRRQRPSAASSNADARSGDEPRLIAKIVCDHPSDECAARDPEELGGAGLIPCTAMKRLDDAFPFR